MSTNLHTRARGTIIQHQPQVSVFGYGGLGGACALLLFFSVYQVGKISFYNTSSNSRARVCVRVYWCGRQLACAAVGLPQISSLYYMAIIMIILCLGDCYSSSQSGKIRDQFQSETIRRFDGRTDIVLSALFCSRPLQQDGTAELQLRYNFTST